MAATVETPRASGPFRLGRPVTLMLIEYPINDEDRATLIDHGVAAVAARARLAAAGIEQIVTDEYIELKNFADELRKRVGVQWTRPAFLPRMEFYGEGES